MADQLIKRDPIELIVLATLSDQELYGYAISKLVVARTGGEVKLTPGVLYPLLAEMERQGLLLARWETVRSERHERDDDQDQGTGQPDSGRKRKWYRLSAKGRKRLASRIEAHKAYAQMIDRIIDTQNTALPEREGNE